MVQKLKQLDKKHLDFTKDSFMANGRKYIIESSLSFERFKEFEKLEIHVGFGVTFEEIFEKLRIIYDQLNKTNFVDSAVQIHNLMYGVKDKLEQRTHPMFLMCALFINREEEDRAAYDLNLMKEKINDWQAEGYATESFFQLAVNLVRGFIKVYTETLKNTLQEGEKESRNTTTNGA